MDQYLKEKLYTLTLNWSAKDDFCKNPNTCDHVKFRKKNQEWHFFSWSPLCLSSRVLPAANLHPPHTDRLLLMGLLLARQDRQGRHVLVLSAQNLGTV